MLTATQKAALAELCGHCDDEISRGNSGFMRSFHLGGTREERSAKVKHQLMAKGLIEGKKSNPYNAQGQWVWRITDKGREALQA